MTRRPDRPLRVLLLNERCHANPLAGGAELHLFEVFGRLAEQGVETELLCCGFEGGAGTDEHRGVRITRIGSRLSYYKQLVGEVRRRCRAGTLDLIVEDLNKIPFLTPLYTDIPVLVMHHHLHGLAAFGQVSLPLALGSVLLEQTIPWVYRRVPFLTVSASSKEDLVRRGIREEHIDVVPNGIDQRIHRAAPSEGRPPEIVSLGRLEPYKRLDLLLRSLVRVVAVQPDAHLHIVGRGQDEARLQRLTHRLRLQEHVTFHGFVTEERKVTLLQQAALLVQCSKKEGWGLTVTEAYACGTPVVASDVPGLSDSVQDGFTGLLVRKAKPEPLATAILRLLLDEPLRVRLARRAEIWSRGLRWDDAAQHVHGALLCAARGELPWRHRQPALATHRLAP